MLDAFHQGKFLACESHVRIELPEDLKPLANWQPQRDPFNTSSKILVGVQPVLEIHLHLP